MTRRVILRADSLWLVLASVGGLALAPLGAGSAEISGLALILGLLMGRAAPRPSWHLTGAIAHLWFGMSGAAFAQGLSTPGLAALAALMASLHFFTALLQLFATVAGFVEADRAQRLELEGRR